MDKKGLGKGAAVGIVVLVIVVGFLGYWYFIRGVGNVKPSIKNVTHEWGTVNTNTTKINSTATVHNPNPIGIDVKTIDFTLSADGLQMATGGTESVHLAGGEDSDVDVTTTMQNSKIPEFWVDHLNRNESTTFKVSGSAEIDLEATTYTYSFKQEQNVSTNILAGLNTEKDTTYTLADPTGPEGPYTITVKSLSSSWGKITQENTKIDHEAVVHNDTKYPLPVTKMRAVTKMNGVKMAETVSEDPAVLAPNSDETFHFGTVMSNNKLVDWWPTHIENGETTNVTTDVYATINYGKNIPIVTGTWEKKVATLESSFSTNLLG